MVSFSDINGPVQVTENLSKILYRNESTVPLIVDAIILSAGLSSRMNAFKPLLVLGEHNFLHNIILKTAPVCRRVHVVCGYRAEELKKNYLQWSENIAFQYRQSVQFIDNPDYRKGMFTSLQAGIAAARRADWVLYHFVDQPHLPPEFYPAFIAAAGRTADWLQPVFRQKRGHPILLRNTLFKTILTASADENLKSLSRKLAIQKYDWDCPFPQILEDFDTPQDLKKFGVNDGDF
ncbi:MAG: nucleotidyltransferase family protein [Calditrichia bacterium]